MTPIRERALDAAVDLIGTRGIRALTHTRVDAHAGLPRGSTSNYFRTRGALLAGVAAWIAEGETRDLAVGLDRPFPTLDAFIDVYSELVEQLTVRYAVRTRARYALFLEATADPTLLAPLRTQREAIAARARSLLVTLGARHPDRALHAFMAFGDGLVLHRLTVDPEAPIRSSVEVAVRACMD